MDEWVFLEYQIVRIIELAKIAMVYGVCNLVHVSCRLT
jgi:hypothetical protein